MTQKSLRSAILLAMLCGASILLAGCRLLKAGDAGHLEAAEQLSRQGNYDQAIAEYEAHIDYRLRRKDRPEWENPYFYDILIGDIQLSREHPEEALKMYQAAEQHGVDGMLISDRFRSLAHWYETHDQLAEAVKILQLRRAADPILFDSMLDRISKEIVRREEERTGGAAQSTASSRMPR